MNVVYRNSFLRDVVKLKNRAIQTAVDKATDHLEAAASLTDVRNLKRLKGSARHYRNRVGEYRIGLYYRRNDG